ncbi:MAG: AGE family epimerase/isomerase [Sphaerochaeta sp.]|nr:AGE family epimerase/isomerase [Sphaerochaeta sp.]
MSRTQVGTRTRWCLDAAFKRSQRLFHTDEVLDQVLPFWAKSFDETYGGVYTCWSNNGEVLLGEEKYVWSQGRMLWLLSCLLMMHEGGQIDLGTDASSYRQHADRLYGFLHEHALLDEGQGVTSFLLDRYGKPREQVPGKGFYTSFYADCFVIMGYAKYAMMYKNKVLALEALAILERMQGFLERGDIRTEPYPLPKGYSTQAVHMILCNTLKELSDCFALFDQGRHHELLLQAQSHAQIILSHYYDGQRTLLREIIPPEGDEATLLARHYNPGHAIECMWFCLDCLDESLAIEQMAGVVLSSLSLGWDEQYGGLFRYVDRDGHMPKGDSLGTSFEKLIRGSWDYKLWWPHAEAIYACLRFYEATGNEEFLLWYERLKAYTFSHFPSVPGMEWIQIRQRDGEPLDSVVALPVKDPYHILRMHLLAIQALS